MIKLYEIMQQFDALASFDIDEEQDMVAFRELLAGIVGTFDEKAENYCKLIRSFEAEADAFKEEKLRLEKKQKALNGKADALRTYLEYAAKQIMETGEKRAVGSFTLKIQQNPEKLNIFDASKIAGCYMVSTPDTAQIKSVLKAGGKIEGAELVRATSLRIS